MSSKTKRTRKTKDDVEEVVEEKKIKRRTKKTEIPALSDSEDSHGEEKRKESKHSRKSSKHSEHADKKDDKLIEISKPEEVKDVQKQSTEVKTEELVKIDEQLKVDDDKTEDKVTEKAAVKEEPEKMEDKLKEEHKSLIDLVFSADNTEKQECQQDSQEKTKAHDYGATLFEMPIVPIQVQKPTTEVNKSISEFDYDDIRKFDSMNTAKVDSLMMLKILIVRGKDNHNPAQWAGAQRLLKQLNCEDEKVDETENKVSKTEIQQSQPQQPPQQQYHQTYQQPYRQPYQQQTFQRQQGKSDWHNQQRTFQPRYSRPQTGDHQKIDIRRPEVKSDAPINFAMQYD